jgi:hypothetical protein
MKVEIPHSQCWLLMETALATRVAAHCGGVHLARTPQESHILATVPSVQRSGDHGLQERFDDRRRGVRETDARRHHKHTPIFYQPDRKIRNHRQRAESGTGSLVYCNPQEADEHIARRWAKAFCDEDSK